MGRTVLRTYKRISYAQAVQLADILNAGLMSEDWNEKTIFLLKRDGYEDLIS